MKHTPFPSRNHHTTIVSDYSIADSSSVESWTAPMLLQPQRPNGRGEPHRSWSQSWSKLLCNKSSSKVQARSQSGSFEALVKDGKYTDILAKLQPKQAEAKPTDLKEWLYASSTQPAPSFRLGESPLHILLQGQPPLLIVNALIQTLQTLGTTVPEAMCDALGRTPLHVACAFACHVSVVARLLNGAAVQFRQPAAVQDASYAIPLHWACQSACAVTKATDVDNLTHVIGFLVQTFPSGLECPNGMGMTPVDIVNAQGNLSPSIRKVLLNSLQKMDNVTDDDTTLSPQQLSWIPNEICLDDNDDLDVSLLGLKGVTVPKPIVAVREVLVADCALTGSSRTNESVDATPPLSQSRLQTFEAHVEPKPVSVDLFESDALPERDVAPVPIPEDVPSHFIEANNYTEDEWCPFAVSNFQNNTERASNSRSTPVDVDGFGLMAIKKLVHTDNNSVSAVSTTHISSSSHFDLYDSMEMYFSDDAIVADELFA